MAQHLNVHATHGQNSSVTAKQNGQVDASMLRHIVNQGCMNEGNAQGYVHCILIIAYPCRLLSELKYCI